MSTEMNIFSPPRYPTAPQQPLPQTILGVSEHSGLPFSTPENITDVPPDFGWMFALQQYKYTFVMDEKDGPGKELASDQVNVYYGLFDKKNGDYSFTSYWTTLPLFGAKWWSGMVSYKFIAIKPPRVTGKLIINYSFSAKETFSDNFKKMKIAKEWDLGQSNVCEFDVSALNQLRLRPTWLPENAKTLLNQVSMFAPQSLPMYSWNMGRINIEVANRLQPGNIFPGSIRILMFKSFKNAQCYAATDLRGRMPHIIGQAWSPTGE